MNRRLVFFPYNINSQGCKELAKTLDCLRVYPDRKYNPKETDIIINWGNSRYPVWYNDTLTILNHPRAVNISINKYLTLCELQRLGIQVPSFTINFTEAEMLYRKVISRSSLTGSQGEGITVGVDPDASLYTEYVGSSYELRVHVVGGEVIDVQQKKKKTGVKVDNYIRTYNNGWVFCRQDIVQLPDFVLKACVIAVTGLNLAFGAVDLRFNKSKNTYWILEINSAPGLEGETVTKYAERFSCLLLSKEEG